VLCTRWGGVNVTRRRRSEFEPSLPVARCLRNTSSARLTTPHAVAALSLHVLRGANACGVASTWKSRSFVLTFPRRRHSLAVTVDEGGHAGNCVNCSSMQREVNTTRVVWKLFENHFTELPTEVLNKWIWHLYDNHDGSDIVEQSTYCAWCMVVYCHHVWTVTINKVVMLFIAFSLTLCSFIFINFIIILYFV